MFGTLKHWLSQTKKPMNPQALTTPLTVEQPSTPSFKRVSAVIITPLLLAIVHLSSMNAYADTQTRASAFEYDPVSGLLTKEIIEPDDTNLCLVTSYTYDSFGNKTAATTRNCNGSAGSVAGTNSEAAAPAAGSMAIIESRTSSTTYDSQGRFPTSSTNALGQTETKTYNPNYGTVATLTGPNDLTTTWTYDSFGKPLTENRADSTSTSTSYALCGSNCPVVGSATTQYTITVSQAGAPYRKTYYDMNGRAIQTETQDKGGALILSQVQYDKLGRSIKTSRPFKSGQTPVWDTVVYDKLSRPITNTAVDNTVTSMTYNGYTTTSTNAKSQTKTETKNSQGQLISVTDAQAKTLTYQYDAFGNLVKTTDALANSTIITYDKRGRKTGMDDPDQGVWSYQYDALGQLKKQTDAKNQNVTFVYDKLGRMTSRAEPDLNSTWAYDTCDASLNPAGKCKGKLVKESADNASARTMLYDNLGRAIGEYDAGTKIGLTKNYDTYGRTANLIYSYNNGSTFNQTFQITHTYSTSGHLSQVKNTASGLAYWTAGATDNEGRLMQTTYGNGVLNTVVYDTVGRVTQMAAGSGGSINNINNQVFVYDSIGNITQRYDAFTNLNEAFAYDSLNRLTSTSAQAGTGPLTQVTMTYDAIGNIKSKSDIGTYTYASLKANGSARPHAVSKITMNDGTTVYANYTYDANGNTLTSLDGNSKGRTITWNSWNMPNLVTGNKPATTDTAQLSSTPINTSTSSFGFVYNASHERVKETMPDGTIITNMSPRVDTGIHIEVRTKPNGDISLVSSLYAGSMPFGQTTSKRTAAGVWSNETRYYHTDHLGSIVTITNETATVVERRSYDAWGKRRNLNGTAMANAFVTPDVRHAFTGHEDLAEVGLIHMNGRLYDAATGRFLSADPTVQFADDMQNYNRYSYINNNPLSAVDHSGYGWNPFKAAKKLIKGVGKAISGVLKNTVVRTIGQIVASAHGPQWGALFAAVTSYADTGSLTHALTAGIKSWATAQAFEFVGHSGYFDPGLERIAGHALVGCGSSAMSGGSCKSGALSAGFTQAFSGSIDNISRGDYSVGARFQRAMAAAIVGGTASVLGGGKFENGAMTGAFSRLYNDEAFRRTSDRNGCSPWYPCLNSRGESIRKSVTVSGGGAFIPIYGVGGSGGIYLSTYPFDIGVFFTGEHGYGIDFGLSAKVGGQTGEINGIQTNINLSYPPVGVTLSANNQGDITGITAGLAPRAFASVTTARTGALSFRKLFRDALGWDQ